MEEKSGQTNLRTVGRTTTLSLTVAIIFYCVVIASSSMAIPWRELVTHELPTVAAFRIGLGSPLLANLVLIAGLFGIVTAWNAVFIAGSRVLFALGRAQVIGSPFGAVHPAFRSPYISVLFVGSVGLVAVFLGRTAILTYRERGIELFCVCLSDHVSGNAPSAGAAPASGSSLPCSRRQFHCGNGNCGIAIHVGDVTVPALRRSKRFGAARVEAATPLVSFGNDPVVRRTTDSQSLIRGGVSPSPNGRYHRSGIKVMPCDGSFVAQGSKAEKSSK